LNLKLFLLILFPLLVFPQKIDLKKIELGKRNEKYRVWVYFIDKQGSEPNPIEFKNDTEKDEKWYL